MSHSTHRGISRSDICPEHHYVPVIASTSRAYMGARNSCLTWGEVETETSSKASPAGVITDSVAHQFLPAETKQGD